MLESGCAKNSFATLEVSLAAKYSYSAAGLAIEFVRHARRACKLQHTLELYRSGASVVCLPSISMLRVFESTRRIQNAPGGFGNTFACSERLKARLQDWHSDGFIATSFLLASRPARIDLQEPQLFFELPTATQFEVESCSKRCKI